MAVAIKRVSEFFLLRDLAESARGVPAERRLAVKRAHLLARQKRDAADVLWGAHSRAEALRLIREAVAIAREAGEAPADLQALNSELGGEHEAQFAALHDELEELFARQLGPALGPRGVARLRANRIVLASAMLVAVVAALYSALHQKKTLVAEASARYAIGHDAPKAIDGSDKTEWLLPDRSTGFIEVQIVPPRTVSRIRILNARNLPYADRASKDYEVEVFLKGGGVKQQKDSFPSLSTDPTWREVPVNARIDRVRITILSHHGTGGGLAEIEID
jgi:hypothetical protein